MPEGQQGAAASIVNTVVNYSISLGLGLAGTLEKNTNRNGTDILRGYRAGFYLGTGLAGLGMIIGLSFLVTDYTSKRKQRIQREDS